MRYDLDHTTPEIESHTTNRPDLHDKTSRRRKEAARKKTESWKSECKIQKLCEEKRTVRASYNFGVVVEQTSKASLCAWQEWNIIVEGEVFMDQDDQNGIEILLVISLLLQTA